MAVWWLSIEISLLQGRSLWLHASVRRPQQPNRRASCTSRLQRPQRELLGIRQEAKAYWDHCPFPQSPRLQIQPRKARTQQQGQPKVWKGSVRQTAFASWVSRCSLHSPGASSRRNESVDGLALLIPDRGRAGQVAGLASRGKPPTMWGIKPAE